jgi:serine/threonine protein kinase
MTTSRPSSAPRIVGPDPWIGQTLAGRYKLVGRLGQGSMGTVYRATQLAVDRPVAVKIVKDERNIDPAANARFLREARANSLLVSPHTVQVVDFGQGENGELFLVMELLEGESLRRRLARLGRFPADVAIEACLGALRSLAEAHAKGVIHRDLKPEHIFFARVKGDKGHDEIVKVLDFGVAKLVGDESRHLNAVETREGRILGTPRYMSPEQAQGKPLDARSDLYAIGVILYEMLTGRATFTADDPIVVMAQHITKTPRLPSEVCPEAQVPDDLESVVMRALSKNPAARPANAEAMTEQLTAILESGRVGGYTSRRSAARISAAPSAVSASDRGTSGGVVVSRTPESETVPSAEVTRAAEGTTVELPRGRPWRRTFGVIAAATAVAAVVVAIILVRGQGSATPASAAVGQTSTLPPSPALPSTPATPAPPQSAAIPVEALPSAAPFPVVPLAPVASARGRRLQPGKGTSWTAGTSRPPPAVPPPRPSGGYDYLE